MARPAAAAIERHGAAEEASGRDAAQDEVGVGHGGLDAAARVAHGPGIGARALRPQRQGAARVDPRDGAAARADLRDVDDRDAQGVAVHVVLVGGPDEAVLDNGAFGGGATHVEGDEMIGAQRPCQARAADRARGRTRLDGVHGLGRGSGEREGPSVRLGNEELAPKPSCGQPLFEVAKIPIHGGPDIRVHHRGTGALVLAPFLGDVVREGDGGAGQRLRDQLGGAPLVRWVAEREEEADGHRLDTLFGEAPGGGANGTPRRGEPGPPRARSGAPVPPGTGHAAPAPSAGGRARRTCAGNCRGRSPARPGTRRW